VRLKRAAEVVLTAMEHHERPSLFGSYWGSIGRVEVWHRRPKRVLDWAHSEYCFCTGQI
jgi:hypothetical protein